MANNDNETSPSHRPEDVILVPGQIVVEDNEVIVDLTQEKATTNVTLTFITSEDVSAVAD